MDIGTNSTDLVELIADEGAVSFYTEAPGLVTDDTPKGRGNPNLYPLAQRVEMNLIATDRILTRYYLGI